MEQPAAAPVRIFISYSHHDHKHKETLLKHLGALINTDQIDAWSDDRILAGDEWDPAIKKALDEADIIVLLISHNFLGSVYCIRTELTEAINRHEAGSARVVPIILSQCLWRPLPITRIQCVPKDETQRLKPIEDWGRKQAHAWTRVAQQISENVKKVRGDRRPRDLTRYRAWARARWEVVDLTALTRPGAEDPDRPRPKLSQLFVPQRARRTRPPQSLPRDWLRRQGLDPFREADRLAEMLRRWEAARPVPVLDLVAEARALVLLGDPGAGKSSLARWLLLQLLDPPDESAPRWRAALGSRLPILIELRELVAREAEGRCKTFLELLDYLDREQGMGLPRAALEAALEREPTLVIFDGLDEIFDPKVRSRIAKEIVGFAHKYPLARVLVTSRIAGFDPGPFETDQTAFVVATLDDLASEQIEAFAKVWFDLDFAGRSAEAERARRDLLDTLRDRPTLRVLAGNPLLLTMMAIVARHERLARSRVGLYD